MPNVANASNSTITKCAPNRFLHLKYEKKVKINIHFKNHLTT